MLWTSLTNPADTRELPPTQTCLSALDETLELICMTMVLPYKSPCCLYKTGKKIHISGSSNFSRLRAKEQCQEVESAQQIIVLQGLFCPTFHSSILNSRVAQSFWFTFHLFREGSDLLSGFLFVRLEGMMCHPFFPTVQQAEFQQKCPQRWAGGTDVNHLLYLCLCGWDYLTVEEGRWWMSSQGGTSVSSFCFSHISLDLFGKFSFLCHASSGLFLHSHLNFLVLYPFLLCHFYLSGWLKLAFPDKEPNQTSRTTEWKE